MPSVLAVPNNQKEKKIMKPNQTVESRNKRENFAHKHLIAYYSTFDSDNESG